MAENARQEFPERPNALRSFLLGLHQGWNITMFHYRNHGAGTLIDNTILDVLIYFVDLGKVLAGIQVPQSDYTEFDAFLEKLNFTYVEETENVVYKRFLRG